LPCFDIRHETLHAPGENDHVRTFLNRRGCQGERIIGLCCKLKEQEIEFMIRKNAEALLGLEETAERRRPAKKGA
jgi:hypothetical protein